MVLPRREPVRLLRQSLLMAIDLLASTVEVAVGSSSHKLGNGIRVAPAPAVYMLRNGEDSTG